MKFRSYQQFAIVQGDTAQSLTEQLNVKMKELHSKHPTVSFEGLIARISYTEEEYDPETLSEEYESKGINLHCEDCPHFQPELNADGSVSKRTKKGRCPFANYGMTFRDSAACDKLYEHLRTGEVRLCLAESEK